MGKELNNFQKLAKIIAGEDLSGVKSVSYEVDSVSTYNSPSLLTASEEEEIEYEAILRKQTEYLNNGFRKAEYASSQQTLIYQVTRPFLYREFDQMEMFPEISVAWDIMSHEACTVGSDGNVLNVYSNSPRVKEMLEELFFDRLSINTNLRMWTRMMVKYGDNFILARLDPEDGIIDMHQLPIYEVERREPNQFYGNWNTTNAVSVHPSTIPLDLNGESHLNAFNNNRKFVLKTTATEFEDFQVIHFRYLSDAVTLPYGASTAFKARRYWRMLMLAEDALAVYRIYRAIDRRVFRIFVGDIDDADVPAYIQQIQNQMKRKEIYDSKTGMMDTKFNIMGVTEDIFLPFRASDAESKLEILNGSTNMDDISDCKFWREKLTAAMRVPSAFLNFGNQDKVADGKNLSLLDVRFARFVNTIQSEILLALNKMAKIHLILNGLDEDVYNFRLTMNNPSNHAKIMELEELKLKADLISAVLSNNDSGIPIMSWTKAQREILGLTDNEIKDELLNIRLEKAMSVELENTSDVIKSTNIFNRVDVLYKTDDDEGVGNEDGKAVETNNLASSDFGNGGDGDFPEDNDLGDDDMSSELETINEALKKQLAQSVIKTQKKKPIDLTTELMRNYFENVLSRIEKNKNEFSINNRVTKSNSYTKKLLNENRNGLKEKVRTINESSNNYKLKDIIKD
jgi:hypothetical protein